ncbi:MAG: hypothetical protein ACYCYK_13000 [Candidatus Dormibacteria bacterium]
MSDAPLQQVHDGLDGDWLVFHRDGSDSVSVRGESRVFVGMVLEVSSGLILGSGAGASGRQALDQCLKAATARGDGASSAPHRILCPRGQLAAVRAAVRTAGLRAEVIATDLPQEAEEILDTMLGALGGYRAASDPPSPATWSALFAAALDCLDEAPWIRVPDSVALPLELETSGRISRHLALVLGSSELEHGVVLLPQTKSPLAGMLEADSMPEGTVGMAVIEPAELPVATRRAHRFGWPREIRQVPLFYAARESGAGEPTQDEADLMLLALAAIKAYDRADHLDRLGNSVRGRVRLPEHSAGRFRVAAHQPILSPDPTPDPWTRRPDRPPLTLDLRSGPVRDDLLPEGTVVHLGAVGWKLLPRARAQAEVHSGPPVPQTRTASGLQVLAIQPRGRDGVALAQRILAAEPLGLALVEDEGELLVVLVCRDDLHGIMDMPSGGPEAAQFRARLAASGGDHAVMVATFSGPTPKRIFGLFECHLDSTPAPPRRGSGPAPSRPRRRR